MNATPAPEPFPEPETVIRRDVINGCVVMCTVSDPADRQRTLYGVVTRADASFVGTYYPADGIRQSGWHIVTARGEHYRAESEYHAVEELTTTFRDRR